MKLIKLNKITKIYKTGTIEFCALRNVDFEVEEGEFLIIIGPSGSGKTTLMNIIGCLDRPTHGEYFLKGKLVSTLQDQELSKIRNTYVGFVFQSFNLLNRSSVLENVILPLHYSRQIPYKERERLGKIVLEKMGILDKINNTPFQLSGGQQQRVAIARALINNPKILCADEPTGNLDSKTGSQILTIFKELNNHGITIIMVTHNMDIAKQGSRIIKIKDGEIQ